MTTTAIPQQLQDLTLVAAGKGTSISLAPIVDAVLDLVPSDDADDTTPVRLLYLGTASYDSEAAFLAQTEAYRRIQRVETERLNVSGDGGLPSREEMRKAIESAHIILCSGGDTLYALNRWKELGIDEMIRQVAFQKDGPVLCGGSAGAVCFFDSCHSDAMRYVTDDKDDWEYTKQSGLGLFPALCVPHHDVTLSNGLARAKDSEEMLLKYPDQTAVGIDEKAALVISDGEARAVSGDGRAKVHVKIVEQDDEPRIRKRPLTDCPVPVEKLLRGDF